MRNKTAHLLALFLMVYIGVEVTIGGIYKFLFHAYFVLLTLIQRMDRNILDARS